MIGEDVMALVRTNLAAAAGIAPMVVTREAKDFAQRLDAEQKTGVITLIAMDVTDLKAPREIADHYGRLRFGLLGEFLLAESATGLQVEQAEWALWEKIKAFLKAPGLGLCDMDAMRLQLSAQVDKPAGWIFVECEFAELD